jgi:glyoxylate reductase
MKKVVLFAHRPLPEATVRRLRGRYAVVEVADSARLREELPDAEGLLSRARLRVSEDLVSRAPRLRVVSNYGAGHDNIDIAACSRRGIVVVTAADANTESTADLTWALLLAVARRIPSADRVVRSTRKASKGDALLGTEVFGKTLGIVGLGRIGAAVARRAVGFEMRVLYASPRRVEGVPYEHVPLERLLGEADFVTLHARLAPGTRRLLGAPQLARMKPGAALINTARGPLVDEAALVDWVARGNRAALDVFEDEPRVHPGLLDRDNVVLTPHIGAETQEALARMAEAAVLAIDDALQGRVPKDVVNPEVFVRAR